MSTILLVRHGQASLGADRYDALSALGERQAAAAGTHLAGVWAAPTRVLCGPRVRHRATWAAMAPAWPAALAPEQSPALDEFAEAEALAPAGRTREAMLAAVQGWALGTRTLEGVEPIDVFRRRVEGWLDSVARGERGQRVLAVTSAGFVAMAAVSLLHLPDAAVLRLLMVLRNASFTEVAFAGPRRSLLSLNVVSHLPLDWRTLI